MGLEISIMARVGQIAQLVEQRTENPRVGGSIPSLATIKTQKAGYSPAFCVLNATELNCRHETIPIITFLINLSIDFI